MSADRGNLMRAIRGPVTLIVVGVLFLVDHLGYYDFHQTWPVLLIVLGLLSLAGRISGPRDTTNTNPGGGPS